jgi:hypothetical protein
MDEVQPRKDRARAALELTEHVRVAGEGIGGVSTSLSQPTSSIMWRRASSPIVLTTTAAIALAAKSLGHGLVECDEP